MTLLVGVLCKDGVVVGADSAATFGSTRLRTMEQPTKKIHIVHGQGIVAGTGAVGLNQRFCEVTDVNWSRLGLENPKKSAIDVGRLLAQFGIADFKLTECPKGLYGALVAFPLAGKPHLCEFDPETFQPEQRTDKIWYGSMGSGCVIADPFLALMRRVFWPDGMPTIATATLAAAWTLQHAVDTNTGGVNGPIDIAVMSKDQAGKFSARMLEEKELLEHFNRIDEGMATLRRYMLGDGMSSSASLEQVPSP